MKHALFATACALLSAGCGSSGEPTPHERPDAGPLAEPAPPPPPRPAARTMTTASLFGGTSIDNLLIDPTFDEGNPGIGRWYANLGTTLNGNGPSIGQRVLSASPAGVALPVASVADAPASGSPRVFSLIAQVPGGAGPYRVSVWISTEKPLDVEPASLVRVALANASGTGLSGTELPLVATRTIADRVWHLVDGTAKGPFTMGAYVVIRFRASRHRWYLQAPQVVPTALSAGDTPMAGKPIELEPAELAAVAAYRRIPR